MGIRPTPPPPRALPWLYVRLFTTTDELVVERLSFPRGGCWILDGFRDKDGYVAIHHQRGHRFMYEELVGKIPDGLVLDHLCRVRDCVNPAHLEPVTAVENTKRGGSSLKTHCPQGHPYSPENTYYPPRGNERGCKECRRENTRRYRQRKREEAA